LFFVLSKVEAKSSKPSLDIYRVNYDSINSFSTFEKGSKIDVTLEDDISTISKKVLDPVDFVIFGNDDLALMAKGFVSVKKEPGRLKKGGSLQLTTSKLYLADGREISFPASSFLLTSAHPQHANTDTASVARYITLLSTGVSPLTFGAGLGVSFLVSGLLSALQNGPSDFFWGGLDGSGLSFLEHVFRKQPELYLNKGMQIPFVLNEEVKINNGLHKEAIEHVSMPNDEAINKIQTLLKWGNLTGALELSIKTGQEEVYRELLRRMTVF
jgi:hypothetical protein